MCILIYIQMITHRSIYAHLYIWVRIHTCRSLFFHLRGLRNNGTPDQKPDLVPIYYLIFLLFCFNIRNLYIINVYNLSLELSIDCEIIITTYAIHINCKRFLSPFYILFFIRTLNITKT